MIFLKLFGISAIGVVCVWLTLHLARVILSAKFARWLRVRMRYARRLANRHMESLGKGAWLYALVQIASLLLAVHVTRSEMSPLALGFVLGMALLANVYAILLVIFRVAAVGRWWASPATKFLAYSVPLLLAYEGRMAGAGWVSELFRMSAANFPLAWTTAGVFFVLVVVSVILVWLAVLLELAMLVAVLSDRGWKTFKNGLVVLVAATFANAFAQSQIASRFGTSALGGLLLSAIAFEYDAVPIDRCDIPSDELSASTEQGWLIKMVPLASSQEKGVIVRQPPALASNVMLGRLALNPGEQREIVVGRVVTCFK